MRIIVSWLDVNFHTYMAGTDIGSNCYSKALIGVCLRIFQYRFAIGGSEDV